MEELMSAGGRKQRIVADITHDLGVQPRLNNDRGTAILVAASIYDACYYFRLFQNTSFGKYCGIISAFQTSTVRICGDNEVAEFCPGWLGQIRL